MKKVIGYIVALVGVIALAVGVGGFGSYLGFDIDNLYFIIGGVVLIVVGIFFVKLSNPKIREEIMREVPIYKGKDIVGYRRTE